jgi:hypothetical protein
MADRMFWFKRSILGVPFKRLHYCWLLLAERIVSRRLFGDPLHKIWTVLLPSG